MFFLLGKYVVVDARYANLPRFLAPYRGTQYQVKEFDESNQPQP